MKVQRLIQRWLHHRSPGVDVAGGVNAAVSANVNEPRSRTRVSSRQRVVQRSGAAGGGDGEGKAG